MTIELPLEVWERRVGIRSVKVWGKGWGGYALGVLDGGGEGVAVTDSALSAIIDCSGSAIVVPKLDNHVVTVPDEVGDLLESPFGGEGACGASADGFVHDGDGEVPANVLSPTWMWWLDEWISEKVRMSDRL